MMTQRLSALVLDYYSLTMAAVYYARRRNAVATFELFVRSLPPKRSFLVACGIEDALRYLTGWRVMAEDIRDLQSAGLPQDFLRFLRQLRFTGDVWAMREGTLAFAEEPILRVTAPLIQAQLMEGYLLSTINLQTTIASKAVRVVLAAGKTPVIDFSLRRTQGPEAGIQAARAGFIAGCSATSNVLAGMRYGIPVAGTMAHSYVLAFPDELSAFRAYARQFPDTAILLLDTYSYAQGLHHALVVARELRANGHQLQGVRLDSGDLLSVSRQVRQRLDREGFSAVRIVASGDLDEYNISRLKAHHAPIDSFGVGTHMGVSSDAPFCPVIYKLSEVSDENGRLRPVMKLSQAKRTLPGRKQVFRRQDRHGRYCGDVIAGVSEKAAGRALLHPAMRNGTIVARSYSLRQTRDFVRAQVESLPQNVKQLGQRGKYPIVKSRLLERLLEAVRRHMPLPGHSAGCEVCYGREQAAPRRG